MKHTCSSSSLPFLYGTKWKCCSRVWNNLISTRTGGVEALLLSRSYVCNLRTRRHTVMERDLRTQNRNDSRSGVEVRFPEQPKAFSGVDTAGTTCMTTMLFFGFYFWRLGVGKSEILMLHVIPNSNKSTMQTCSWSQHDYVAWIFRISLEKRYLFRSQSNQIFILLRRNSQHFPNYSRNCKTNSP